MPEKHWVLPKKSPLQFYVQVMKPFAKNNYRILLKPKPSTLNSTTLPPLRGPLFEPQAIDAASAARA